MRRDPGVSNFDFFTNELNDDRHTLLDAAAPNPALVFFAVRTPRGVECWMARCRWDRWGGYHYWLTKESESIHEIKCPKRILDRLDPVEDLYDDGTRAVARTFRERCTKRLADLAAQPTVKRGDLVHFNPAIKFRGAGGVRDVMEFVRGGEFRAGGWRFWLRGDWKLNYTWSVMEDVSDEERKLLLS